MSMKDRPPVFFPVASKDTPRPQNPRMPLAPPVVFTNDANAERDYYSIAEELPELTLEDIDPAVVRRAQEWAHKNDAVWPPKPISTGWQVAICSFSFGRPGEEGDD